MLCAVLLFSVSMFVSCTVALSSDRQVEKQNRPPPDGSPISYWYSIICLLSLQKLRICFIGEERTPTETLHIFLFLFLFLFGTAAATSPTQAV